MTKRQIKTDDPIEAIEITPEQRLQARKEGAIAGRKIAKGVLRFEEIRDEIKKSLNKNAGIPNEYFPVLGGDWWDKDNDLTLACRILDLDGEIIAKHGQYAMAELASEWTRAAARAYQSEILSILYNQQI